MEEREEGGSFAQAEETPCGPTSCSSIGLGTWETEQAKSREAAISEARRGGEQKCKGGACAGSKQCRYLEVENRDTDVEVRERQNLTEYRVTVVSSGRCRCV